MLDASKENRQRETDYPATKALTGARNGLFLLPENFPFVSKSFQ